LERSGGPVMRKPGLRPARGIPSGLSPLARQGNVIVIAEASHDACLFPRMQGAEP